MIGAIIGDTAGSTYEFANEKTKDFPLFAPRSSYTDDSIMTIAVGSALLRASEKGMDFSGAVVHEMRRLGRAYPSPMGGYGTGFQVWLLSAKPEPYGSYGNGSAMRASPCGEIAKTLEEALCLARQSAEVTHNHPDGIRGAQAVAAAVYLARSGESKEAIRRYIDANFYPLIETVAQIRPEYAFESSCRRTVPQAMTAFLESENFEDAIRTAVSLGGDSDTLTCITGSVAWAYYARRGLDERMRVLRNRAMELLPPDLREVVDRWERRFGQI